MTRRLSFLLSLVAACGGGGATVQQQEQSVKLRVEALDKAVAGSSVPILISVRRGNATVRDYAGMLTFNVDDPAAWHPTSYRFTEADAGQHVFDVGFVFPQGVHVLTVEGEGIDEPAILGISVPLGPSGRPPYVPPPVPPGAPKFFSFWQRLSVETPADSALGDVDGDGDLDVIAAGWGAAPSVWGGPPGPGTTAIWLNDGKGNFTKSSQQFFDNRATRVVAGDVDGDGDVDLLLLQTRAWLWVNRGDGTFDAGSDLGPATFFALADIDRDGDLDLVLAESKTSVVFRSNNGHGKFDVVLQTLTTTEADHPPVLADLDADGDVDVVAGREIWANDGKGRFTTTGQAFPGDTRNVIVADLDADGDPDLLFANFHQDSELYMNDGKGNFAESDRYKDELECVMDAAALDLDEDGDLDAVFANGIVYLNQGGVLERAEELTLEFAAAAVRTGDLNGDGRVDFVMWPIFYKNE